MARKNKALLALARRKQATRDAVERISGDLRAAEARLDEIHSMELELEEPVVKGRPKQIKRTVEADKAAFEKMRAAANAGGVALT